jgi:hypothetical protein
MTMYKSLLDGGVYHRPSAMSIPPDPANRHWRTFLEWQDAGNAPEPADPEPESSPLPTLPQRIAAIEDYILLQELGL